MYWFITFPNEPKHALHEELVDFNTMIRLMRGEISSQLPQMSRIYKMMLRYSKPKARRFLTRFPKVYWAPEEESGLHPLYFGIGPSENSDRNVSQSVAWWKKDDCKRVVIFSKITDVHKNCKLLQPGREFTLFYDENAGCKTDVWQKNDPDRPSANARSEIMSDNKELFRKNNLLRQNLSIGYAWQQEAYPYQVDWIKKSLSGFLKQDAKLWTLSKTHYEIRRNEKSVGIVVIMEYKIYLTLWPEQGLMHQIFTGPISDLISMAARKNIEIMYTNSL